MYTSKKTVLFLILIIVNSISAQEIITDRPDQTESSVVVPFKSLQIETGAIFQKNKNDQSNSYPSILWRYGVSKKIELRLLTQFEVRKTINSSLKSRGVSDIQIGAKVQLFKKEDVNTEVAFLSHLILPTAKNELTNHNFGTINKLSISHSLSKKIGVGYNVGYDYFGTGSGNFTYSLAFGISLTHKIGFFTETYGEFTDFKSHLSSFDTGFTYLLRKNLQLDISYGTGINYKMNFFSTGFSWNIDVNK